MRFGGNVSLMLRPYKICTFCGYELAHLSFLFFTYFSPLEDGQLLFEFPHL